MRRGSTGHSMVGPDATVPTCGITNANGPFESTMMEDFRYYTTQFGCTAVAPDNNDFCTDPTRGSDTNSATETYKHATGCKAGVVVNAYALHDGAHTWYATTNISCGNTGNRACSGTTPYNAQYAIDFPNAVPPTGGGTETEIIWEFLKAHPRP